MVSREKNDIISHPGLQCLFLSGRTGATAGISVPPQLNTGLNGYKLYCFSNKCTFDASGKAEIDPGITAANGIVLATLSGNGSSVIYNTAFVSGKIVMYAKHIATGTVYIGSSWVGGILFYE